MKKRTVWMIVLCLLSALFFSACAEETFGGEWYVMYDQNQDGGLVSYGVLVSYILKEDGSFAVRIDEGEEYLQGTWETDGDKILVHVTDDNGEMLTAEGTIRDGHLTMANDGGSCTVLTRNKEEVTLEDVPSSASVMESGGLTDSEEALSTEGKTQVFKSYGADDSSGIYLINGNDDIISSYQLTLIEPQSDSQEPVTAAKVTFLEGDEHLRGFFRIEEEYNNPDGRALTKCLPAVTKAGSASYQLDMVSEHCYASCILHVRMIEAKDVTATLAGDVVNFPLNTDVWIGNVFSSRDKRFVLTEPEVPYRCSLTNTDGESNMETDEMKISSGSLTIKQPGDYPMTLTVTLGEEGHKLQFPITIHADESIHKAAVVGRGRASSAEFPQTEWPGKPDQTVQQISSVHKESKTAEGTFTGKEVTNAEVGGIDKFLSEWTYVPSTLPKEVTLSEHNATPYIETIKNKERESLVPDTYSVEFVSGDAFLKDALAFETHYDENGKRERLELFVRNETLTQPGKAEFRIRLALGKLYYETDYTLRVLNWEENPLFELVDPNMSFTVNLGRRYYNHNFLNMALVSHADEIAARLNDGKEEHYLQDRVFIIQPEDREMTGLVREMPEDLARCYYTGFTEEGVYPYYLYIDFGNLWIRKDMELFAVPYGLIGPARVRPGETVRYIPYCANQKSGLQLTLKLEGGAEGITLDEEGRLTVAENVPAGTAFRLSATPSDGSDPAFLDGRVTEDLYQSLLWETREQFFGFSVPRGSDKGDTAYYAEPVSKKAESFFYGGDNDECSLMIEYSAGTLETYLEDPAAAEAWLNTYEAGEAPSEIVQIDGHPARLISGWITEDGREYSCGIILWVRDNHWLRIKTTAYPLGGRTGQDTQPLTAADLRFIAGMLSYAPPAGQPSAQNAGITITGKDDAHILTAGKKLQLTAAFDDPTAINKKNKNDTIEWTVTDTTTGGAPADITIDARGSLTAAKTLAQAVNVEVKAASPIFLTSATYAVTVIPAAAKISADPAELFFYVGTDTPQTVKAILEPDNVPPLGITWTPVKKDIVEITETEAGTVSVRPLKAGTTTVAVKEPGGKNAKLNVTVTDPVTSLELTAKGKAVPGGTVTVTAGLQPKTAGNKTVTWALDVGGETATVTEKGQVKISKEAPAGTVIHVTCTALGAPEPVSATVEIIVSEK